MRDITRLLETTIFLEPEEREILWHIRNYWRIPHVVYRQTMNWLNVYTSLPFGALPVLLIGPPKTGRTSVMRDQDALLITRSIGEGRLVRGSGYSPLGAPVAGKMDVSTIYADIVRHALEPLADFKIPYPPAKQGAPESRIHRTVGQTRAANLQVIEKMAKSGNYKALFLDDAGFSATLLKANRVQEAPAVFQDICNRLGQCTLVVSGGPEVYSFLGGSANDAARFAPVWMPPYYSSSEADVEEYSNILATLEEKKLGPRFIEPGTLTSHCREIMNLCFGTIGMTLDMVLVCVIFRRLENKRLDWETLLEHLENNAKHCGQTIKWGQEFFESARRADMSEYRAWFNHFAKHKQDTKSSDAPAGQDPSSASGNNSGLTGKRADGAGESSATARKRNRTIKSKERVPY